eukprot:1149464-Pelagomonas_calceolata.AAC.3
MFLLLVKVWSAWCLNFEANFSALGYKGYKGVGQQPETLADWLLANSSALCLVRPTLIRGAKV